MAFSGNNVAVVVGSNPAANAEFSETVPVGTIWKLLAVSVSLAQGITQTPRPALIVDDGTNIVFQAFGASNAQNASVTTRYTWAPGLPLTAAAAETVCTAPLPSGLVLPPGWRVRSLTGGIGAATDYAAPVLYVAKP